MKPKFPNEIFVRDDSKDGGDEGLIAYKRREGAVERDEPHTYVAEYKLVSVKKFKMNTIEVK